MPCRRRATVIACAACAFALGCGSYRLHVALEEPPQPKVEATVTPSTDAKASNPDAAEPPKPAAETPKADAEVAGADADAAKAEAARARAAQLGERYRDWKAASDFLARRLERGLEAPSIVREELLALRLQLADCLPFLDEPLRAQVRACAEQYDAIAAAHVAGRSGDTARELKTLTRKVQRMME